MTSPLIGSNVGIIAEPHHLGVPLSRIDSHYEADETDRGESRLITDKSFYGTLNLKHKYDQNQPSMLNPPSSTLTSKDGRASGSHLKHMHPLKHGEDEERALLSL